MTDHLNDFAGSVDLRMRLREPFPPHLISKLPATSKRPALDYVSHAAVTDRLNSEAPGWTYELTKLIEVRHEDGSPHLLAVFGYMQIGEVVRWEVGDADGIATYGREMKGAISDFIRRAAMRFGVGLDLWAKEDLTAGPALPSSSPEQGRTDTSSAVDGEGAAGEQGTAAGDTGEGASAAVPNYLSKDDQALLKVEYGSQLKALDAYRAKWPNVSRLADITYEMRDKMMEVSA